MFRKIFQKSAEGNYKRAEECWRQKIVILEGRRNNPEKMDSMELALAYYWLGVVCEEQNKLDEARSYYTKALDIQERQEPDSLDTAVTCHSLGGVYEKQTQPHTALHFYNKALVIQEHNAPDTFDLATTYNNVGAIYSNQNELDRALWCYKKAMDIVECKVSTHNDLGAVCSKVDLAKIYYDVGVAYDKQNKWFCALQYYEKAMDIHEDRAPGSLALAKTYYCLGDLALSKAYNSLEECCLEENQLETALLRFEQALVIQEQLAPISLELAHTLTSIGVALVQKQEMTKAKLFFDRALLIFKNLNITTGLMLAKAHRGLGDILAECGCVELALKEFQQVCRMLETTDPMSLEMAKSYTGMADSYITQEKEDEALHFYSLALAIYDQYDPNTPQVMGINEKISMIMSPKEPEVILTGRAKLRDAILSHADVKPVELPLEYVDYVDTHEEIGKGFFGAVFKGYDKKLEASFAIKTIHDHLLQQGQVQDIKYARNTFLHEIELYGYHLSDDLRSRVCLVFELAEKGSLDKFWADDFGRSQLSWQRRLQIALDIATALAYLHGGGDGIQACFHRDIKSANICLKSNFTAQLIDCGLAKFVREENVGEVSSATRKVGTPGYICPLYQSSEIVYDALCDVYSFGVVLMELILGQLQNYKSPSSNKSVNFARYYIKKRSKNRIEDDFDELAGEWEPAVINKLTALAVECMNETDEDERPGISEVVQKLQTMVNNFCRGNYQRSANNSSSSTPTSNFSPSNISLVKGVCRACMIQSNDCMLCNDAAAHHVHCRSCLDCHLHSMIGKRLVCCPFVGCKGDAFSDKQLSVMAHPNTWLLHLSTRNQNAQLEYLTQLSARAVERCPRLFVIVEADKPSILRHPRDIESRPRRLYFTLSALTATNWWNRRSSLP